MSKGHSKHIKKVYLFAAFSFVSLVSFISPVTEYERTVYNALPWWQWGLFYGLILAGVVIMAYSFSEGDTGTFRTAVIGMVITFFGFFYIPFSRGYFLNSGVLADTLPHLGMVKDILNTGQIPRLIYPATHWLMASLQLVSDISLRTLPWLVSFVFYFFFVTSIYIFTRTATRNRRLTSVITLLAFTPLFARFRYEIMPWMYAVPFIFLLVALIIQHGESQSPRWGLVFLPATVALVLFHPFTGLYGLLAMMSYLTIQQFKRKYGQDRSGGTNLVIALATILLSWHLLFLATVEGYLRRALIRFLGGSFGPAASTAQQATGFDYTIIQFLTRFMIGNWGDIIYLGGIAGVVAIGLLIHWHNGGESTTFEMFVVSQYLLGGIIAMVFLLIEFYSGSIRRAAQYPILMSIFLAGIGIYRLAGVAKIRIPRAQQLAAIGVIILIIAPLIVVSTSIMYAENRHVTVKAAEGYDWQFGHTEMYRPIVSHPEGGRFVMYDQGYSETLNLIRTDHTVYTSYDLPDRLGYDESASISRTLNLSEDSYLITRSRDREFYKVEPEWRWPDLRYYTDQDYELLRADRSANRIYSNGGFEIWSVEANK